MRTAIKKDGKIINAYELGKETDIEKKMIEDGKIIKRVDGTYEIFSQEAINGEGEIAKKGDFFKLDSSGHPYPNSREFFLENHQVISEEKNEYIQKAKPVKYYTSEDGMTEELKFLLEKKGLRIDKESDDKYYNAFLWGSNLGAAKDASIIFYSIDRNEKGEIVDIDYNFVKKEEFDRVYEVV